MKAGLVLGACLPLLVASPVAAQEEGPPEVAVITVGGDAAATGTLQYVLQSELARVDTVMALSPGTVVERIGVNAAFREPIWPARVKSAELLRTVQEHYYKGDLEEAAQLLVLIAQLHAEHAPVPAKDRINLLETEAAVLLANGDTEAAAKKALISLTLAPDREVDTNIFRPSFARFMKKHRKDLEMANVVVAGLPPGADIRIDGRPTGTRFVVPIGEHRLFLRAPGFRAVDVPFQATADHRVTARLPLDVAEEDAQSIEDVVWAVKPTAAHRAFGKKMASSLGVKVLVLASVRRSPEDKRRQVRSVIFWDTRRGTLTHSAANPGDRSGMAALAAWTSAVTAKGPPTRLSTGRRGGDADGFAWSVDGGVATGLRAYDLDAQRDAPGGGGGTETVAVGHLDLFGAGARVNGAATWRFLFFDAGVAFMSYRLNSVDVRLPDGSTTVSGGDTVEIRAGGGYRYLLALGEREPLELRGALGLYYDRHYAETPGDVHGGIGFLPSHRATGLRLGVSALWPLSPQIDLGGGLRAHLLNQYGEQPEPVSGTDPAPTDFGWELQANWRTETRWALGLLYEGRRRTVDFSGDLTAPTSPTYFDAKILESWHTVTVSARRTF